MSTQQIKVWKKRSKAGIVAISLFLLLPLLARADTAEIDLSGASGNSYVFYRSPSGWELGQDLWNERKETRSDMEQGTFENMVLKPFEDRVVLDLPNKCSGSFISKVHSTGETSGSRQWLYTLYIPNTTQAEITFRHGSTPTYDPSTWSGWLTPPPQTEDLRNVIGNNRYLQYRVTMASNETCSSTPSFGAATFRWREYTLQSASVTTSKMDQIRASLVKHVSVTHSTPQNTEVKWGVSDDNGLSYKKYSAGTWVSIDKTSIPGSGNTTQEFLSIPMSAWNSLSMGFLRLTFSLKTTNGSVTPSVSAIRVDYDPPQVTIDNLVCPSSVYVKQKESCSVVAKANVGNLGYQWSGSTDSEIAPEGVKAGYRS